MSKLFHMVALLAIILTAAAQFMGPKPFNPPIDSARTIEAQLHPPQNVSAILDRACHDCHSNKTSWRWYSGVAPVSWLQMADVYAGRDRMNFSDWSRLTPKQQDDRLKGICELTQRDVMPRWYYRPLHIPHSIVTDGEDKALCDWSLEERKKLQSQLLSPAPESASAGEAAAKGAHQRRYSHSSAGGKLIVPPGTEVVHLPDPRAQH